MRRIATTLLLVAFAAPAWAKDEPNMLREAEKLVEAGKEMAAVEIYAKELALAQRKGEIQRQQDVVRAMLEEIHISTFRDRDTRVAMMRMLMKHLDPKKAYAYCYAGGLAHGLIHEMTIANDRTDLASVLKVCEHQAKRKGAGAYEGAMLMYAQGLKALDGGESLDALRGLDGALSTCIQHGWNYSAALAGLELAAALVAKGDSKRAAHALRRVTTILTTRADVPMSADWIALVKSRLADAPKEALLPFTRWLETRPTEGGLKLGTDGADGAKSSGELSRLGAAWKKLPKSKPFVTVTARDGDYEIFLAFDKKNLAQHQAQPNVTHFDRGGVTLSFWDRRVRLFVADLQGWRAIPGAAYRPHPLLTYTALSRGDVWGVTRKGEIIVKRAK